MTNHWIDFKNSDVILIMGSNPASNHPVSFNWIQEAIDKRGAKVLCVDPRFTQSASNSIFIHLSGRERISPFLAG